MSMAGLDTLSGIGTALLLLGFIGLCIWAYSPRQQRRWDESAQLPFLDDDAATRPSEHKAGAPHE